MTSARSAAADGIGAGGAVVGGIGRATVIIDVTGAIDAAGCRAIVGLDTGGGAVDAADCRAIDGVNMGGRATEAGLIVSLLRSSSYAQNSLTKSSFMPSQHSSTCSPEQRPALTRSLQDILIAGFSLTM